VVYKLSKASCFFFILLHSYSYYCISKTIIYHCLLFDISPVICPWCSSFCYVLIRLSQLLSIVGIFLFLCHILIHLHTFLPQFRSSDTEHAYPFLAYKLSASMRMHRHELARTIARECRLDFSMQVATFGSQLCTPRLEVSTKSSPVLRRDYAINPCLG
jgi:hypothetical protein